MDYFTDDPTRRKGWADKDADKWRKGLELQFSGNYAAITFGPTQ